MSEVDYSFLNNSGFDYAPYNLDKSNVWVQIHKNRITNIRGYGFMIKDGNKFFDYLKSIAKDEKSLSVFSDKPSEADIKFSVERIIRASGDKSLDNLNDDLENKYGVYLAGLILDTNFTV